MDETEDRVIEVGKIVYLLEPEYHNDSIRGVGKMLVFHDYGLDIVDTLLSVGFSSVDIVEELYSAGFDYRKGVISVRKEGK